MRLQRYCTCGAVLDVTINKTKRDQVLGNWFEKHSGDGHKPAKRKGK